VLAEVAAALGDGDRAATLLELLAPWAARSIVFDYGWAFLGSAARPAGLLAAALGRHDEAVRHLEQAYEADARTGAQAWLAHDLALLGHALSARAESGDSTRAADLLARAEALSERLGIAALPGALAAPLAPSER
jgi:tetratricopeptide (TPR) repeat protein